MGQELVSVIRCADCKFYGVKNLSVKHNGKTKCCIRSAYITVSPMDYCSFAVRKDEP